MPSRHRQARTPGSAASCRKGERVRAGDLASAVGLAWSSAVCCKPCSSCTALALHVLLHLQAERQRHNANDKGGCVKPQRDRQAGCSPDMARGDMRGGESLTAAAAAAVAATKAMQEKVPLHCRQRAPYRTTRAWPCLLANHSNGDERHGGQQRPRHAKSQSDQPAARAALLLRGCPGTVAAAEVAPSDASRPSRRRREGGCDTRTTPARLARQL